MIVADRLCSAVLTKLREDDAIAAVTNGYYAAYAPHDCSYPFMIIEDAHMMIIQTVTRQFYRIPFTVTVYDRPSDDCRDRLISTIDSISERVINVLKNCILSVDNMVFSLSCMEGKTFKDSKVVRNKNEFIAIAEHHG